MRQISISELSTLRWSFYQDVIRYAAAGFESMGVWRQKIDDCDTIEAADFLHEMRMNVSSVHWAGGFTGGNGMSFNDAIEDAIEAIQLTAQLDGGCLIVHPGGRNGHTTGHAQRLFFSALSTLVPIASDFGVKLAIEPMPCRSAAAWTFLDTLDYSLDLLNQFPESNLGLVLDLYHVGLNAGLYEALPAIADRIALVQLSDRRYESSSVENRLLLGTGNVPLTKWFHRLQQIGYRGQFEIELHGEGLTDVGYDDIILESVDYLESIDNEILNGSLRNSTNLRRPSNQ